MMFIAAGLVGIVCLCLGGLYGLYRHKNKRITPDYYDYYKHQDARPTGKTGIVVTGLIMPETLEPSFFYNITRKIFNSIIPWPFRLLAQSDRGVALLDPGRHHEEEPFVPERLEDPFGNDCDHDGEPYIEKYKQGLVKWVPPSRQIYLDHGYFLYTGRKGGMPTLSGKTINRARLWYYGGLTGKKMPHEREMMHILNSAFARLQERHAGIACVAINSLAYHDLRLKIDELLDGGCETIILASPMVIYSHFEEFNSSFYHCFEYIHAWERQHAGKKIKVIIAPPAGHFQPLRQAFLAMLKDRLDTLPQEAAVVVAITFHGMPWDRFPWEAWLELAPPYRDRLVEEIRELLAGYSFNKTKVVVSQDEFANPVWDPKEKYLSTNRVFRDAVKEGYHYVIALPVEYLAENSDTLFQHAQENYHGFSAYTVYDAVDYPDLTVPYVREIRKDNTTILYNGVPVGKYQGYVIEAFYQALDSVLAHTEQKA